MAKSTKKKTPAKRPAKAKKPAAKTAAPKRAAKHELVAPRTTRATTPRDPHIPAAGTTLTRTFKGETYALKVTEGGFVLGKENFRSLTAAAKHVTRYPSISGVRFWLGRAGAKGGAE